MVENWHMPPTVFANGMLSVFSVFCDRHIYFLS